MYDWRQMTPREREDLLACRKEEDYPWHSPPHFNLGFGTYHLSAACFEHVPVIGHSMQRMAGFQTSLLGFLKETEATVVAWCILPNHCHVILDAENVRSTSRRLGQLHGRTSFEWNTEERKRGRQVWYRCTDRKIRSERHYWATMNYVLNNAVHHGYVDRWEDWPFSSAEAFLRSVGTEEAKRIWQEYPILDYGKGWDDAGL